ncbi:MAG: FkbM family methyltransferase [Chloroflexi bacterium]|nr:FkbM family methyltransferase [Chloroflexota bacterium]
MFLCATRVLAQKVIRFCFAIPALENFSLFLLDYAIAAYRRLCSAEPILTVYDDDLKIWVRLTKLLEANLYFFGMDGRDRGEVIFFKSVIKPDDTVFDVGGNVGQISLLAAKRAPQGSVHVFEPAKDNYQRLLANIEINHFKNVTPNKNAVSNRKFDLTIYAPRTYNTGAISAYPDAAWETDAETVQAICLDDYVTERQLTRVNVMKIDVEGAEMDVLEGSQQLLRDYRPQVFMEVTASILARANQTPKQVFDFWKALNYSIYRIDDRGKLEQIERAEQLSSDQNIYCSPVELAQAAR